MDVGKTAEDHGRALSLLGLARASGELLIGQDQVLRAHKAGSALFMLTSCDCSINVLRRTEGNPGERRTLDAVSREKLGAALGLNNAQIVALPLGSGFVKKLKELLKIGGTLNG
ncbi:MAG: hypothetical protein LBT23_08805 [Synergistaceae bacterium]|nr:hypothetical protein [Synergistaceae bacterium]